MEQDIVGYVSAGVCNIYTEPSFRSEVTSQAVLWEALALGEERNGFLEVTAEDGIRGWVYDNQIARPPSAAELTMITHPSVDLHEQPDLTSTIVRRVPAGGYVCVVEGVGPWTQISLPDGAISWTDHADCTAGVSGDRSTLLALARSYLGVSYLWGGKTPWGFDCSGFVQLLYKLTGTSLRRDAWMQHEDGTVVSRCIHEGAPGDLLFFAEGGDRITHVAMRLEADLVIHASGWVRIASLAEGDPLYNPRLAASLVDVRSFLADQGSGPTGV